MTTLSLDEAPTARRWVHPAILIVGALIVFAAHFRPWEVAFLEEWPLADLWMDQGGFAFAANFFEWSISRPLHLVPTALGLALTGGAPLGIWIVLGAVAAGQFLVVMWALRPVSRSSWINGAIALFIALHPLWPGGFLQRFLPAQTAALALFVAAGLVIRYVMQGRIRWIIWAGASVVIGLCVYPGIAVAAPMMALVIAVTLRASWRRRVITVVGITIASGLVILYSLVIAKLFVPSGASYEASNFSPATVGGPREFLTTVGSVLLDRGLFVLAGIFAIVLLGAILALSGAVPHWAGWLISGSALVSPLCALVFYANAGWLQDIERVAYATSLGLAAALFVWAMARTGKRVRLEVVIAVGLVLVSLLGAARGINRWQPYIALQHQIFAELAPAVHEAEGDEVVLVIDHSGVYGSEYTLPQPYLSAGSQVMNNDPTVVWLCYLEEDPPLAGAQVCDDEQIGDDMRHVNSFDLPSGTVDIYVGVPAENQ
ncbi:hypothetical protein [Microbacterium sp. CGR1]|uniref:hypothetical protein n=1 Tax=Microbacterium sp. CGR1 TaxID=1696072 RepID=UPI003DA219DF